MAKTLRRQRPFDGKSRSRARQRPFDGKGPSLSKVFRQQSLSKAKDLRWQKALRRQKPLATIANAIRRETPFDDKRPSMTNALRWQKQRPSKGKSELYDCNKQTSSFITITRILHWYGWVGGCGISRESRSEHVAAVKTME